MSNQYLQCDSHPVYSDVTRIQKRPSAPVSLAVFLCLKSGVALPYIRYGRVERLNTIPPLGGNMPGATFGALVDTRPPALNWRSKLTKIQKVAIMPNTSALKQYRAVSIHTKTTHTVIAHSFAGAAALLPADAAIICRTPVTRQIAQEVAA